MMHTLKYALLCALLLLIVTVAIALLIIAYQSQLSGEIISEALTRFVDQRLIERATQAIIERELGLQNAALWLAGLLLLASNLVSTALFLRLRRAMTNESAQPI
ncbi:hypothetical protein [Reinekea forsetii]|jgi:hypothetical protein|nr:hypothetical protein [Reinekea forsetii]